MLKKHNEHRTAIGPETAGVTLHNAGHYDLFSRLTGLGASQSNSKMVVEMAGIRPGDRVLDVACGTGNLTLTAKKTVGDSGSVYGIDASPEMIVRARKNAGHIGGQVEFEVGLIEKLAFPEAAFDVVISRLAIHHLPDDLKRRGFAEVFRVLKPGRLFFIADFRPPANPLLAHLASALVGHGMLQSNVQNLPPMLTEAGFVEVASGPTRSAFLAFVRGRKPAA